MRKCGFFGHMMTVGGSPVFIIGGSFASAMSAMGSVSGEADYQPEDSEGEQSSVSEQQTQGSTGSDLGNALRKVTIIGGVLRGAGGFLSSGVKPCFACAT